MRPPPTTPTASALVALVAALPDDRLRPLLLELLNGASTSAPAPAPAGASGRGHSPKPRRGWPLGKPRRGPGRPPVAAGPKARAIAAVTAHPEKTNRAIAAEIGVSVQTVMRARAEASPGSFARKKRRGHGAKSPRGQAAAAARKLRARSNNGKGANGQAQALPKTERGAVDPKLLARRQRATLYQRRKREAAKAAKASGSNGTSAEGLSPKKAGEATPTQAFWQHAEALQPTAPYRAVASELGINLALSQRCYRSRSLPPNLSSGAVEKFCALELPA